MRVQYVVLGGVSAGVLFKLEGKLRALNDVVDSLRLTLISRSITPRWNTFPYEVNCRTFYVYRIFNKMPILWRLEIWIERLIISYIFYREVSRMDRRDIILIRYPGADFFLNTAFWLLGKRTFIFEHNTKELNELRLRAEGSYWFRHLYRMEKRYGTSLRNKASSLVAVTSDFLEYQRQTYGNNILGKVISNGYSVTGSEGRVLKNRTGVHFMMLIGSYAEWHGLEIFVNALRLTNTDRYSLHVVGSVPDDIAARISKYGLNIVFHGKQDVEYRLRIAGECHIGVGALGLARLDVQKGSSLKVREYLAWGMPVIVSVDDEDLHDEAYRNKYAMKVSVEDGSFDLNGVADFFGSRIYEQEHIDNVREYARRHIDHSVKATEYLELFKSLVSR